MKGRARHWVVAALGLALFVAVFAARTVFQGPGPESTGIRIVDTAQAYDSYVARLSAAIAAEGMTVVEGACGKCGIETVDVADENALILTISRPGLMLRMLRASAPAGADPPLRFYVSRLADGTARLTYHRPSAALAVYEQPALQEIGAELDADFERIVAAAAE